MDITYDDMISKNDVGKLVSIPISWSGEKNH